MLGAFVPVTTNGGYTLYESFGPGATGGTFGDRMLFPPREGRGEVAYDALLRRTALREAAADPARTVRLALEKQRRFWNILPNHEEFRSARGVVATLCFAPVLAGFLAALVRLRRLGAEAAWLLAPVFYFGLLHLVFLGSIRYRLPVEPFVIASAAWAVTDLWECRRRRKTPEKS